MFFGVTYSTLYYLLDSFICINNELKIMTIQTWFVLSLILILPLASVIAEMKRYLKNKRINHKK